MSWHDLLKPEFLPTIEKPVPNNSQSLQYLFCRVIYPDAEDTSSDFAFVLFFFSDVTTGTLAFGFSFGVLAFIASGANFCGSLMTSNSFWRDLIFSGAFGTMD